MSFGGSTTTAAFNPAHSTANCPVDQEAEELLTVPAPPPDVEVERLELAKYRDALGTLPDCDHLHCATERRDTDPSPPLIEGQD